MSWKFHEKENKIILFRKKFTLQVPCFKVSYNPERSPIPNNLLRKHMRKKISTKSHSWKDVSYFFSKNELRGVPHKAFRYKRVKIFNMFSRTWNTKVRWRKRLKISKVPIKMIGLCVAATAAKAPPPFACPSNLVTITAPTGTASLKAWALRKEKHSKNLHSQTK